MITEQTYYSYYEQMSEYNHEYATLMIEAYYAEVEHRYTKAVLLKEKAYKAQQAYYDMIEGFDYMHY